MKVHCCSKFHIGPRFIKEKDPLEDNNVSHGFCLTCYDRELAEVEQ